MNDLAKRKTYQAYSDMKQRCYNQNAVQYKNYGGRGITVCDRWLESRQDFIDDMGLKLDGMSLDRIDNSQGYSKENCRWATAKQQRDNQRNSKLVELDGEIMCLHDWARKGGMNYMVLKSRLSRGMTLREAISKPVAPQDKERGLKAAQTRWAMQKGAQQNG